MKTIAAHIKSISEQLDAHYNNLRIANNNAWHLTEHATKKNRLQLITQPEELTKTQLDLLAQWINEIVHKKKPIQYILGSVPFLDLTIKVEPPILIPRPETEEWCALLIEKLKKNQLSNIKILDLCTGSGCIALALAKALPKATVYAIDINEQAVQLTQKNALKNNIPNIIAIKSNLYEEIPSQKFDIITANPPYISSAEYLQLEDHIKIWEDPTALVAENSGLKTIEEIIAFAPKYLQFLNKGVEQLWIEIGHDQASAVVQLFKLANIQASVLKDLQGKNRVVTGKLV
jgi:release factor glutamine methyltransferase